VPKDTFLNLPEEKRKLITEAAIDEFAAYSFELASVNRIVASAGIAKGSFYQYFEDKKDLYLYILDLIGQEKLNYLAPAMRDSDGHDLFMIIREMFRSGAEFAVAYPRYAAIGSKLAANTQSPIFEELQANSRPTTFAIFEPLIKRAIAKGEVRADIDITMLNYIVASLNLSLVEYCAEMYPDNVTGAVVETVDVFMDFLKNGIGARAGNI
jgi:AcrR family transcriptional regulator